jgi:hypothetical protein
MLRIDLDMSPDLQKYLFDKGFCVTEREAALLQPGPISVLR